MKLSSIFSFVISSSAVVTVVSSSSIRGNPSVRDLKRDDQCPNSGSQDVIIGVDCSNDNIVQSLDALVLYLTSGSDAKTTAIVTDESTFNTGDYESLNKQYASATFETSPSFIVQPKNEVDVQAAVKYAAICNYQLNVRSGGHAYIGSSSCDGDETACLQLDMGEYFNSIEVIGNQGQGQGKQLRVGPGVRLGDLANVMVEEEVYIPTGECDDIGVGGHMQTGGLGIQGRAFGYFAEYVDAFNIVLGDGSIQSVTKPGPGKSTTQLNDDLYYATLGGASGSFGAITQVTLDTIREKEYHSFYYQVKFLYNIPGTSTTFPGIKNMMKKYGEMLEDEDFQQDPRWGIFWNFLGLKTYLSGTFGPASFNYLELDVFCTEPKTGPGHRSEEEAAAYCQDIIDTLTKACTECVPLDLYFDGLGLQDPDPDKDAVADRVAGLKARFNSPLFQNKPLSQLLRDVVLENWELLQLEEVNGGSGFPYEKSYQQGPTFPDDQGMEEILDGVDALMPNEGTEFRFVIVQIITVRGVKDPSLTIALPFQEDKFGVVADVWDLSKLGAGFVPTSVQDLQNRVKTAVEADHRMWWNPTTTDLPNLTSLDQRFLETAEKFDRLKDIKTCVDPDDLFKNAMSIPTN